MNEVLAAIQRERQAERESFLGPYSASVIPQLVQNYAPQGMEILALGSANPLKVDERGMVHFEEPALALVREKADIHASRNPKKVVGVTLRPNGVNGNFFTPIFTERDSNAYAQFRSYMRELVQDPNWRDRPLPGKGFSAPLSESEQNMWNKWVHIEIGRDPAGDKERWSREQGL
ncbi:hypothetical protein K2P56_01350 [Patescibacteria group bacterium]|nr:hypothetical protein [Patescibacteria group bacterium]